MKDNGRIRLGIIGGSGLYQISGIKDIEEVEVNTPFGRPSDRIVTGVLEGMRVSFLPRHGKGHSIMPHGVNYRANIFALKKLGVEKIISVSAVGSMKENLSPGDVVLVDQFFDRTKARTSTFFGNGLVVHIGFAKPVCETLSHELYRACVSEGVKVHRGGTYLCIEGPQFSTLGESTIYRKWGVDVIGMTAIPEAKLAREAEICYATMALVTDYDCWHPDHDAVTVDVVVNRLKENSINAKSIITRVIQNFAEDYPSGDCACSTALKNSVMTSPELIDPKMKKDLDLLIGKYLR
ncbi:MAG: S-methyl-5'-thioadenosine phosphorylase [Elusimicrobia bacterium]|nr:S-methyl-5'-thioadenosine phosphorylase [Elusimicrobiota bacterium]